MLCYCDFFKNILGQALDGLAIASYDDEEFVSSNVAVDDKRVYNRKKSSCEAKQVSKKKPLRRDDEFESFFMAE